MTKVTRRSFLKGSAASVAATSAVRAPHIRVGRAAGPVAVASSNGMEAVRIAVEKMRAGLPPVDAAVLGVEVVENDPKDMSVGYGGLPNEDGVVTLDACVMDGRSGLAGAVACLENIKNPAQVALKVMRRSDHVLLVGEGALRFARAHGFPEVDLLTPEARERWLRWKEGHSGKDDWIAPEENGAHGKEWLEKRQTGTIHLGAVDAAGDCGGCTTTSGLAFKIAGRVGDSPLIGCGNYVDNEVGVAGATGRGEAVIIANGAARTVRYMADGLSPTDACVAAMRDLVRMTKVPRLLRPDGRPAFDVKLYAANKAGEVGAASIWPSHYARMVGDAAERVATAALFE